LVAHIIVVGELSDRAHIDRWNARGFGAHVIDPSCMPAITDRSANATEPSQ
jgi:hypothetical protein